MNARTMSRKKLPKLRHMRKGSRQKSANATASRRQRGNEQMPLPTWHIVDELRRAAGFREMMARASDATEASSASDSKDADLMRRAAARLEALEANGPDKAAADGGTF